MPGVDNVRHDVRLSPKLMAFCAPYILLLILKHSGARRLLDETVPELTAADRSEFKRLFQEVLLTALSLARAQQNPELDLLANLAVVKYLGWEVQRQYQLLLLQGKNKMKTLEGPRGASSARSFETQQIFSDFQTQKKLFLRLVTTELQRSLNEVQADAVRKTRESYFGAAAGNWHPCFANPLIIPMPPTSSEIPAMATITKLKIIWVRRCSSSRPAGTMMLKSPAARWVAFRMARTASAVSWDCAASLTFR